MSTYTRNVLAALTFTLGLAACGGGGSGGGGGGGDVAGIALPSEVSALPATGLAGATSMDLPVGDYAEAVTTRAVSEHALSQFDILNTIFGAVAQTHYAEAGNVGTGPYAAMVSWLDNNDDRDVKRIVRWVVDSKMVTVDGRDVNRVKVWFFEVSDGQERIIKVGMDIYEAPTRNEAGGYSDYGVWTINARLADDATEYFTAAADRVTVDGQTLSRVMINQADKNDAHTRGILFRADGLGYGRVSYADWNQCDAPSCSPPVVEVAYVYDADNVALQRDGETLFKSRADTVDVVRRYGLYDAATGTDVTKTFAFGFPLRFTQGGIEQYGYYGAWQGHHQIWANGAALPPGLTVHRGDRDSDAVSYVTSDVFRGVLTQRTYAASDLDEITGVVLNTWVGQGARVVFDGAHWNACVDPQWAGPTPTCASQFQVSDLDAFFTAQDPEQVNINRWSQSGGSQNLVYQGGQFWVANPGPNGQWIPTATAWTPQADDEAWVWRNGPVWMVYDGATWWKKSVAAYDAQRNQPTFGPPEDDTPYAFVEERDYNLNNNGVNYIVRLSGGAYSVRIERQQVPNPVNAATLIPADLRFRRNCCGDTSSVFRFVTNPALETYLQLVYDSVGLQDQASGKAAGDVVGEGVWDLTALLGGTPTGDVFSWDYPTSDDSWAVQQYLLQGGAYQVLHDPLRFAPIFLTTHGGQPRKFALQYDGSWLGGVPDVQQLLRDNGGDMTADIAEQVVTVDDGQRVTDAADAGRQYVFKPLQIAQFLMPVEDPGNLDLGPAAALDLSAVPAFVDPGMGAPPSVSVRYSEGLPVQ
jgi:hypothetical protein